MTTTTAARWIVPADIVGAFTRGTDPVDETRRADYLRVGDWHMCIRSGDASTFDAPGYTVEIRHGLEGSPHVWSDHCPTRAACEWAAYDVVAAVAAGDYGDELAGMATLPVIRP